MLLGIVNLITRGTQIPANAGEDGAVVVEEIHRRQQAAGSRMISFDALRGGYGDLTD